MSVVGSGAACDTETMPDWFQRLLRRGPKYGVAEGVAVLGSPGFEHSTALGDVLTPSAEFAGWAADHGVPLTQTPESLAQLDGRLDEWADSEAGPSLGNEVGLYLGAVLVQHVRGATWVAWPNGHPVVRLASGKELDVVRMVNLRLQSGRPRLAEVYQDAVKT
jgi:hypothetical protein